MLKENELVKVERYYLEKLEYKQQENLTMWINRLMSDPYLEEETKEEMENIKFCIENNYCVPEKLMRTFMEMIRDEIFDYAGGIRESIDPLDAINRIEDANSYAKLYWIYKEKQNLK